MKKILICMFLVFSVSNCRTADETGAGKSLNIAAPHTVNSDSISINFAARINELKEKLSSDFIVKEHSYFVIASNLSEVIGLSKARAHWGSR